MVARYVAPPIVKHVVAPVLTNPATWAAGWVVLPTAGIAYLMFMDKPGIRADQKRAAKDIADYQSGKNVNPVCHMPRRGRCTRPNSEWNVKAKYFECGMNDNGLSLKSEAEFELRRTARKLYRTRDEAKLHFKRKWPNPFGTQ